MAEGRPAHTGTAPIATASPTNTYAEKASDAMTVAEPTHSPTESVGTVRTDQRGMQWKCRHIDPKRGPLYVPAHVTTTVLPTFMASEDDLADDGVILTAVAA